MVYDNPWWENRNGRYCCIRDLMINGREEEVIFFENEFLPGENVSRDTINISFELDATPMGSKGRYIARKIHDEDTGPYSDQYFARHITSGAGPPRNFYNGRNFFLLHTVFDGGNSATRADGPRGLRSAFMDAKGSWLKMYRECEDDYAKDAIFALMSLCAADLGAPYYKIANARLDAVIQQPTTWLSENIGYALCDCSTKEQRELFKRVRRLGDKQPLMAIRLLSKAMWGNPAFLTNMDRKWLLGYFDIAADRLKQVRKEKTFNWLRRKEITACLEYILAVYRLRSLGDEGVNRYLSRNNPIVEELYRTLESLVDAVVDGTLEIRSFLKLDISGKKELYQDMPDLLYALLVYVTGDDGAGDIKITGLSLEDIEV